MRSIRVLIVSKKKFSCWFPGRRGGIRFPGDMLAMGILNMIGHIIVVDCVGVALLKDLALRRLSTRPSY